MKTEFIPIELSDEMIRLGFDDFTIFFGDNYQEYLLWQQAFRWFREKYGLVGLIHIGTQEFSYDIYNIKEDVSELGISRISYNGTYEEAELACLKKIIEIAKNK